MPVSGYSHRHSDSSTGCSTSTAVAVAIAVAVIGWILRESDWPFFFRRRFLGDNINVLTVVVAAAAAAVER